jgi:hypothetical protein
VFTRTRHYTLSWARWIQFTSLNPLSFKVQFNVIPLLRLGHPSCLFLLGILTIFMYVFLISSMRATCTARLILLGVILLIFSETLGALEPLQTPVWQITSYDQTLERFCHPFRVRLYPLNSEALPVPWSIFIHDEPYSLLLISTYFCGA